MAQSILAMIIAFILGSGTSPKPSPLLNSPAESPSESLYLTANSPAVSPMPSESLYPSLGSSSPSVPFYSPMYSPAESPALSEWLIESPVQSPTDQSPTPTTSMYSESKPPSVSPMPSDDIAPVYAKTSSPPSPSTMPLIPRKAGPYELIAFSPSEAPAPAPSSDAGRLKHFAIRSVAIGFFAVAIFA